MAPVVVGTMAEAAGAAEVEGKRCLASGATKGWTWVQLQTNQLIVARSSYFWRMVALYYELRF